MTFRISQEVYVLEYGVMRKARIIRVDVAKVRVRFMVDKSEYNPMGDYDKTFNNERVVPVNSPIVLVLENLWKGSNGKPIARIEWELYQDCAKLPGEWKLEDYLIESTRGELLNDDERRLALLCQFDKNRKGK